MLARLPQVSEPEVRVGEGAFDHAAPEARRVRIDARARVQGKPRAPSSRPAPRGRFGLEEIERAGEVLHRLPTGAAVEREHTGPDRVLAFALGVAGLAPVVGERHHGVAATRHGTLHRLGDTMMQGAQRLRRQVSNDLLAQLVVREPP